MWMLTILLLFASGDVQAFTFQAGAYKHECQSAADRVWRLNEVGFHVISATCERVKGV